MIKLSRGTKKKARMASSEFGDGFAYPLGLFLAHAHNPLRIYGKGNAWDYSAWFNAAGDHLYGMKPEAAPTEAMQKRARRLRGFVIERHGAMKGVGEDDYHHAVREAKELLLMLDRAGGVRARRAGYE